MNQTNREKLYAAYKWREQQVKNAESILEKLCDEPELDRVVEKIIKQDRFINKEDQQVHIVLTPHSYNPETSHKTHFKKILNQAREKRDYFKLLWKKSLDERLNGAEETSSNLKNQVSDNQTELKEQNFSLKKISETTKKGKEETAQIQFLPPFFNN
jgi:hypothetical protein